MKLESEAFAHGESIPPQYTCDGGDTSPPLAWDDVPAGTEALALVMDDPDAPGDTWVHWLLFNVSGTVTQLAEGASGTGSLPSGSAEGTNSWGRRGYGGPCPPSGVHRYYFRAYALDRVLDLEPDATAVGLREAMTGHVLAEATLMGQYERR